MQLKNVPIGAHAIRETGFMDGEPVSAYPVQTVWTNGSMKFQLTSDAFHWL